MGFNGTLRGVFYASVSAGTLVTATTALANPDGPNVIVGNVSIDGLASDHVIIDNQSMRSIVDWNSFSIGAGETTTINQMANDAAILNRVVGGNLSEIYGTLESNGRVFLINEHGIMIGASGLVDTNGFVASTLDMSNDDFLGGGDMVFRQGVETGGGITLHGKIRSVSGGDIFLLSREIEIGATGEIDSNGGYVGLGAGEEILLRPADSGDGRISIRAGKGRIVNKGMVQGAIAELKAAGGNEYALAINNSGVVRATGAKKVGGRVMLTGGGKVKNSGRVVAQKKVIVRSTSKIVNQGTIAASDGTSGTGGEIVFEAPEIVVDAGSLLDVSGALGGGRMFIGGGYQGSKADRAGNAVDITANAEIVTVEAGAVLNASATGSGDAGDIVIWADGSTSFAGHIEATAADGKGGFAEVSGREHLNIAGLTVAMGGGAGNGTLLLDPSDITISATTATGNDTILDSDIETLLQAGASVVISTAPGLATTAPVGYSDTASGSGNINIEAGARIRWNTVSTFNGTTGSNNTSELMLAAQNDINVANDVIIQNTETGDGVTSWVQGTGGVRFFAGGNINIGTATGRTADGQVVIGSEFGRNTFVAGVTDFLTFRIGADGSINIIGGDADGALAQLGYQVGYARGGDNLTPGRDIAVNGLNAKNGDILVRAGGAINLSGGTGNLALAQIGHGGAAADYQISPFVGVAADIVASEILVESGVYATAASKDIALTSSGLETSHAQIGHGSTIHSAVYAVLLGAPAMPGVSQGDISGDIRVVANNGGDVTLNAVVDPGLTNADTHNQFLTRIGHGGHLFYTGSGGAFYGPLSTIGSGVTLPAGTYFDAGETIPAGTILTYVDGNGATQTIDASGGSVVLAEAVTLSQAATLGDVMTVNQIVNVPLDAEISAGRISGDITVLLDGDSDNSTVADGGDVILGASVSAANGDDKFSVLSQIGHGTYGRITYVGAVLGDTEIKAEFGAIANFRDISGAVDADGHGTDINIEAGSVQLVAINTSQNSAGETGDVVDNLIRNQIGHGSVTRYASGTILPSASTTDTVLVSTTQLPDSGNPQASGAFEAEVTYTNVSNVSTGAAGGTQVQNLDDATVNNLSPSEAAALAAFMATNPADTDVVPATVDGVTYTVQETQNSVPVDIDALVAADSNTSCSAGSCTVADLVLVDTSGWTPAQQAALQAFIDGAPTTSATAPAQSGSVAALDGGQLDLTVIEGDIAGNISVFDNNSTDDKGVILTAEVTAGLTAITRDVVLNRIGHGTASYILGHDGNSNAVASEDHDAGTVTIDQANILGANLLIDTATKNGATEEDNQDIILTTLVQAGLAKVEANTAVSSIGHGGEVVVLTGSGGSNAPGNALSGHGGDLNIERGTIWDGIEAYGDANSYYTYGGSMAVDFNNETESVNNGGVDITLVSSDQVIFDNQTKAALAKAEANNAMSQAGHGSIFVLGSGDGGTTSNGGSGGRGGDISVTWDQTQGREYGFYYPGFGGTYASSSYDDYARGIMGDITIYANHDGSLTGTDGGAGYALSLTSKDQAALAKADHNTDIAQIGHGDFFEIVSGAGGNGGDLNGIQGQINGGRGGDIDVALQDMKTESDIVIDVQGAVFAESKVMNALAPEKHGLVETQIGHGSRAYAVAGDGGNGGTASDADLVVGFNPDLTDDGVENGSAQAYLRDANGEILRGGAVGGDGGDISIAFGDITDRYLVTYDNGGFEYKHDGYYQLWAARDALDDSIGVSGDSNSDITIYATHNESASGADLARSVYLHSQVTHALSEGPGSEVNSQIGHEARIQAQGGKGGNGGTGHGATNSQVNFDTLQADFSGGNGGDVSIYNGKIIGDVDIEAERQVEIFAQSGHGRETIVTTLIGHNTNLVGITRTGGMGGDLSTVLGDTGNNIQEYWETSGSASANAYVTDDQSGASESYTVSLDLNEDGDTDDAGETQTIEIWNTTPGNRGVLNKLGVTTIEELGAIDLENSTDIDDFERVALAEFIAAKEAEAAASAVASNPLFTLVLQDLNQDDQFSLGDSESIGTNADATDTNGYHDDGIGIVSDGNNDVTTDKQVQTATYTLLFGDNLTDNDAIDANNGNAGAVDSNSVGAGVDKDLTGGTTFYQAGVNPTNTEGAGQGSSTLSYTAQSGVEDALMVYDRDGNPQFILVQNGGGDRFYVANTQLNRDIVAAQSGAGVSIVTTTGSDGTFDPNSYSTGLGVVAEFYYDQSYADGVSDLSTIDLSSANVISRSWVYNVDYSGAADATTDGLFTYVDLNMDGQMDLVDFDADGKFDIVDIDQNGVYDRIDGRIGDTGYDANNNRNIIDYTNTTGTDFNANKLEGGWSVSDLSHADGGRGGNASVSTSYTEGDIGVYTGNVNFAANEAYGNGADNVNIVAAASGVTDSLYVHTDVQDNIVATGGTEDTVITRIGHGAYSYADTGGEYDDDKVGRTIFVTDTDSHGAATGGDAGMHALNASGGDGGDGISTLGADRAVNWTVSGLAWTLNTELDHLVGDISINTRMSMTDATIVWDPSFDIDDNGANGISGGWVSAGGYAFVADPKGDGIVNTGGDSGTRAEKARNESSANRVVVSSKVDNAAAENIGIAQIGHGAISIVDATDAKGGNGLSGNGSEIEAHQTEIANGGAGGDATSTAHHIKGDITVLAGRAPDPADEVTSIEIVAEEGPRIVPGSSGDIVIAQIGHGRIGYAGSGAGGESDDAQWIANGGRGGDATTIQREILDAAIVVNSSDLFGHGMDVLANAFQGSNHIVRAQIGMGDLNFAESNAGGNGARAASSVVEQWNQQVNGGRGGDAVALQAGYQYDITIDVGAAPDTMDADKASLRVMTDAQNIFLGTENHILATIGSGGYSHAESASASGGDAGTRSALGGIATGNSETPFSTYVSYRDGGRGGNAISEIGLGDTGRVIVGRESTAGVIWDKYGANDADGADITVRTHDKSYDDAVYRGIEYLFNYGNVISSATGMDINILGVDLAYSALTQSDGTTALTADDRIHLRSDANSDPSEIYGRYDGIKVESKAGPGDNHTRAVDTNTAQIGHSGFNRADAQSGEGISGKLAFGRIAAADADGGKGIYTIFSANIQEGDGGNGGDAVAYTGGVNGDVTVTNVFAGEANNIDGSNVLDGGVKPDQDADTNIVVRATGGTVKADHRVDARVGHNVASEAVTDSNGGNAARPPQPVISFIAAVSSRAGGAGDASSIQGSLSGDISVVAENSVILEAKKTTLAGDEAFFVGIGHRLENDLEALGQGGISGMIGAAGTVKQAWFKDAGDDNNDDSTLTDQAIEEDYLLSTYAALYEVKRRMSGTWDGSGAVSYKAAYQLLSAYEKSLVAPVLGDPTATGEAVSRSIASEDDDFYAVSSNYYGEPDYPNSLITTYDATSYNGSETSTRGAGSQTKLTTADSAIDHRFGGLVNNEGYGSGKDVSGIAGDQGAMDVLTVIFGARDNDAATNGIDDITTPADESAYGNIPAPSADEIETLRYVLASSGDGGSVRSVQGSISGAVAVTANAYDAAGNTGSNLSQADARGIYVISNDAALSGSDLFAVIGHGSELIKARAGDAGLHHDTAVQTTASMGGDGGDAIVEQGAISGDISLTSAYVIDIEAQNNGLGFAEEDTRIGHQLKVGSLLEDFSEGTSAAVVAGIGGQDVGLGGDTRNGNGGDVTIIQGGASGAIGLLATSDIADGEGVADSGIAIRIFANNGNISGDDTEVHVGHDQTIDSAKGGDAGRMHALNSFEGNKGLIGVMEGKGGDVTVSQALLAGNVSIASADVTDDIIDVQSYVNSGNARTLIGHDTTAGKEWQDGELDQEVTGNRLVAGLGGDSLIEMFDDVSGGEADGGSVRVIQGTYNANGTMATADDYYEALSGDVSIGLGNDNITILGNTGQGGNAYVELGHQLKLSARGGDGGVQRGITPQTAGDGGDVIVTRGRISGNVSLDASGVDGGYVDIAATTGLGAISQVLLGHGSESILTSGRSGYGTAYSTATYDGVDDPEGSARSSTLTVQAALAEIAGKADADLSTIDIRDAKRLIDNTVAALEMALQYADRMTSAERANLQTALDLAEYAQASLNAAYDEAALQGSIGLTAAMTVNGGTASITDTVKTAAAMASDAVLGALTGATGAYGTTPAAVDYTGITLQHGQPVAFDAASDLADAGGVYELLFGDHADGGDIRIDENTDMSAVDAARISGDVTVTGNAEDGYASFVSGAGLGTAALLQSGHRLVVRNTTGEGGGDTDGGPPDGGDVGDGGSIALADSITGDVAVSANAVAVTVNGDIDSVGLFGHAALTENFAGMSDIKDNGLGNGGSVDTSQTVAGDILIAANMIESAVGAADRTLTVAGLNSSIEIGHLTRQSSESDDDTKTASAGASEEYNRGGDIVSYQSTTGDVTIDMDLADNGAGTDLIVDAGGESTNRIRVGHDAGNFAFSGKFGGDGLGHTTGVNDGTDGDGSFGATDGDGQMVTVTQIVSGDVSFNGLEDLQLVTAGGGLNIGHDADNTGVSGDVAPATYGDDYGEQVRASQAVSGAINLVAMRSVEIANNGTQTLQVGHTAIQTAKSADNGGDHDSRDGEDEAYGATSVADVNATQTVGGDLTIASAEIALLSTDAGMLQIGHDAAHNLDTDYDPSGKGDVAGHIEASSTIGGALMLTTTDPAALAGPVDATIASTPMGTITVSASSGTVQFGHAGTTTTGHDETSRPFNGSVDSEQLIAADIAVSAFEDLLVKGDGGVAGIGHTIAELNAAMGTSVGEGHENTFVDADGDTQFSSARQYVRSDISVITGDSLAMTAAGGEARIGHSSPEGDNHAQIGVSDQWLSGDITVLVGSREDGIADGVAPSDASGDDDALIDGTGGLALIGHDHVNTASNEVQISSGDIWVEVGADLHVVSARIGHNEYDFASTSVDAGNSYDLSVAQATLVNAPDANDADGASQGGVGTIRNRIQGNTTIGAAQNTPSEDSTTVANVMMFETANINSGYGGQGDADVDGELRFFIPSQENLSVETSVFNDSSATSDAVPDRTVSSGGNVFEEDGGNDHEEYFALMSDSEAYSDEKIGLGNFVFYFEKRPSSSGFLWFLTPYINLLDLDPGFGVGFDPEGGPTSGGVINMGELEGQNFIGTSSFQIACEEEGVSAGMSREQASESCARIVVKFPGMAAGFASSIGFSATAGGNQTFNNGLGDDFESTPGGDATSVLVVANAGPVPQDGSTGQTGQPAQQTAGVILNRPRSAGNRAPVTIANVSIQPASGRVNGAVATSFAGPAYSLSGSRVRIVSPIGTSSFTVSTSTGTPSGELPSIDSVMGYPVITGSQAAVSHESVRPWRATVDPTADPRFSYGQYIDGEAVFTKREAAEFPNAMSTSSGYTVFVNARELL